jgi:hypothetical protein
MKNLMMALAASLALAGCNSNPPTPAPTPTTTVASTTPSPGDSPTATVSPSATPTPTHSAPADRCANEAAVTSSPDLLKPGSVRGDIDGDSRSDVVRIAIDPSGADGCRAFVVVHLAGGSTVTAPIPQWEPTPVLPAPHLNSLARIDGAPGDEVVIDVAAGASTQFEGVYTHSPGGLAPVTVRGTAFNGLFAYGGSVGHLDGEACTGRGTVVISGATENGVSPVRYKVVRSFFQPGAGILRYRPSLTQRKILRLRTLQRLPEFSGAPFAGCPGP